MPMFGPTSLVDPLSKTNDVRRNMFAQPLEYFTYLSGVALI
jgi:hypothetical protein